MSDPPVIPPPPTSEDEQAPEEALPKRQFPFSSRKPPLAALFDHRTEGIIFRTPPPPPPTSAADHETSQPPATDSQLPINQESYAADHEAESSEWTSSHGRLDVVNSSAQTSKSGEARKGKKTVIGVLTKKFVDMIKHTEDGTISVTNVADTLKIEHEPIYNVTNVLEEIGLVKKAPGNKFQWKGRRIPMPGEPDIVGTLQAEVDGLTLEDRQLEEQIREMQERINDFERDKNNQKLLFVTEDDIKSLPCFHNQALVAIKAPAGTTIEVPDPDETADFPQRRYRLILTSTKGPIDIHLVSQFEIHDVEPPPSFPSTSGTEEIQRVEAAPSYPSTSGIEDTRVTTTVIADSRGKGVQMQGQDNQQTCADLERDSDTSADDYWLFSDHGVSLGDLFGGEAEVEWSEFGALSPSTSIRATTRVMAGIRGKRVQMQGQDNQPTCAGMAGIRGKRVQMQGQDNQPTCADINTSQDITSETTPIFPSNVNTNPDDWLLSDPGGSITDMFCPEAMSNRIQLRPLSHEEHVIDNVSMIQHQISPSNGTSMSLELSELGELPDEYPTDDVSSRPPETPPNNTTGVPSATSTSPGDGKSPRG